MCERFKMLNAVTIEDTDNGQHYDGCFAMNTQLLCDLLNDLNNDCIYYKNSRDGWKRTAGVELDKSVLFRTKYKLLTDYINELFNDCDEYTGVLSLLVERINTINRNLGDVEEDLVDG